MTSLLGRLLQMFPESVPLEDHFTEAVARLFETKPALCTAWLEEAGLIALLPIGEVDARYVRVSSQRPFASLEHHDTASCRDLLLEVYRPQGRDDAEDETISDVVMVESKIGSKEGQEKLRRYAEHLNEKRDDPGVPQPDAGP
jgi:hypothetical protein